jgi:hypothetical protein
MLRSQPYFSVADEERNNGKRLEAVVLTMMRSIASAFASWLKNGVASAKRLRWVDTVEKVD